MTHKKILENVYYAAEHLQELHLFLKNDLLADDVSRAKAAGAFDAYSQVLQMIRLHDTIGSVDYKKVFNMLDTFPKRLYPSQIKK